MNAVVRRGLLGLLRDEYSDLCVGEAEDARTASGLLLQQQWDLVILDINMPGPSGLEVLAEIRRQHAQTPVLVLSPYPEEEIAVRAIQLGAAGYLNKKTAFDELLVAVRRILGGSKYVTSSLAERMASALGGEIQAVPHEALSARRPPRDGRDPDAIRIQGLGGSQWR